MAFCLGNFTFSGSGVIPQYFKCAVSPLVFLNSPHLGQGNWIIFVVIVIIALGIARFQQKEEIKI